MLEHICFKVCSFSNISDVPFRLKILSTNIAAPTGSMLLFKWKKNIYGNALSDVKKTFQDKLRITEHLHEKH